MREIQRLLDENKKLRKRIEQLESRIRELEEKGRIPGIKYRQP